MGNLFEKSYGEIMEPKFNFADSESIPWLKSEIAEGVEVKTLCSANSMIMELYQFAPNITYPDQVDPTEYLILIFYLFASIILYYAGKPEVVKRIFKRK